MTRHAGDALQSALRVSELVGADWQDIDYNKREITVTGKGNKTRVCPLGEKALLALREYAPHYERSAKKAGRPGADLSLNVNRRMVQRNVPRTIRKWCHAAGVKVVNPHAFRHSAATYVSQRGQYYYQRGQV